MGGRALGSPYNLEILVSTTNIPGCGWDGTGPMGVGGAYKSEIPVSTANSSSCGWDGMEGVGLWRVNKFEIPVFPTNTRVVGGCRVSLPLKDRPEAASIHPQLIVFTANLEIRVFKADSAPIRPGAATHNQ